MKKLTILILSLLLCAAYFTGCGKDSGETTAATGINAGGNTTNATDATIFETLGADDLITLPEDGKIDGILPDIDIDVDTNQDDYTKPTYGGSNTDDGNTPPDVTTAPQSETSEPTDNTEATENTEPLQPTKDYTDKTGKDDFVIDFGDLIGNKNP